MRLGGNVKIVFCQISGFALTTQVFLNAVGLARLASGVYIEKVSTRLDFVFLRLLRRWQGLLHLDIEQTISISCFCSGSLTRRSWCDGFSNSGIRLTLRSYCLEKNNVASVFFQSQLYPLVDIRLLNGCLNLTEHQSN